MEDSRVCPRCHEPISLDAPAGICPRCLLLAGIDGASADGKIPQDTPTLITEPVPLFDAATLLPEAQSAESSISVGCHVRYFGDYELLEEIARGGMGVVFKARQVKLKRLVALKMILAGQLANESEVRRFHAEAESAAGLDHPGIVPIFEIGQHEGQHFFSMAFVEGESLAIKVANGPLPPREAAETVRKIATALQYAHEQGIIHRDLKPANVLVDQAGQPRVTDFGIAKQLKFDSGLTSTGQILGTPSYMPPEQAGGKVDQVGRTSDVYSLGAILYCLLTGRPPFQAATPMDTLLQVLEQEPVPVRQLNTLVPVDLETIVHKCLQKESGKRYVTADQLVAELTRFLAGEPIVARPVTKSERVWRWCRRNPSFAGLGGSLLMLLIALAVGGPLIALHQLELRKTADHARHKLMLAQVDALLSASPEAVPVILDGLRSNMPELLPQLQRRFARELTETQRTRVSLALLANDPNQLEYLKHRMMDCPASEFLLIRNSLAAFGSRLSGDLWQVARDSTQPAERQFRAACALALLDQQNPQWSEIAEHVVRQLVKQDNMLVAIWTETLRPVQDVLSRPLAKLVRAKSPDRIAERILATSITSEFFADRPEQLASLLVDVDANRFTMLFPKLAKHKPRAIELLRRTIDVNLRTEENESLSESLASQSANAAIGLVRLGVCDEVWPLLRQSSDPRLRSYLIHRFGSYEAPISALIAALDDQTDPEILQALVLALGGYPADKFDDKWRRNLEPKLFRMYQKSSDPGVHGATAWLLAFWYRKPDLDQLDRQLTSSEPIAGQKWLVNSECQTYVIIKPQAFLMGSGADEHGRRSDETRHPQLVSNAFAIASREVTVSEFQRFLGQFPQPGHTYSKQHSPDPDCPQNSVTFYEAAAYCNWLSRNEGVAELQLCFLPNVDGKYAAGMRLADNYLERVGYRLPTEAEWELACRAGSVTSRCYGEAVELLEHYAWFLSNSLDRSWPVGTRYPNAFGLFDMHGNVWEWCADVPVAIPESTEQPLANVIYEHGPLKDGNPRALRGGSYFYHHIYVRSALRNKEPVDARYFGIGLRPVRTMP